MGPFTVLASTAPKTYRLDIPAAWRVFPDVDVERLRPYLRRPDRLGGDVGPPPPAPGADGGPEREAQELLRLKVLYVLVRWVGREASGDTWEPLDNTCAEAIAAFDRAAPSPGPARRRPPPPSQPRRHPSPGRFHRGSRAAR